MTDKIRPRNLVFAVLLFSAIIIGFSEFSTGIFDSYSVQSNDTLELLDRTGDYEGLSTDLKDRTETKITGIDPLDNFIVGTFSAIQFLFELPDDIATFITMVGDELKLPGGILSIVAVVVSLIVAFTIIEAITKGEI